MAYNRGYRGRWDEPKPEAPPPPQVKFKRKSKLDTWEGFDTPQWMVREDDKKWYTVDVVEGWNRDQYRKVNEWWKMDWDKEAIESEPTVDIPQEKSLPQKSQPVEAKNNITPQAY